MSVCLSMIVRDESHVVAQALASVAPFVDCAVIVDTGSRDDTIDVVRQAPLTNLTVHERPWRNFGWNRSEALTLARGKADYVLVFDADDLLVGEPDLRSLTLGCYQLRIQTGSFVFWRRQLLRDELDWHYEGVVHEYPVSNIAASEARLEGDYHVEDRHLGARAGNTTRHLDDAELLRRQVERNPDDSRSMFYLAQSLYDAGAYRKAIRFYRRRVRMGGFAEEVFYSLLKIAFCLELTNVEPERVTEAYLAAYEYRPSRAEPLHELARYYRQTQRPDLARLFDDAATTIPFPESDVLFVARDAYASRFSTLETAK